MDQGQLSVVRHTPILLENRNLWLESMCSPAAQHLMAHPFVGTRGSSCLGLFSFCWEQASPCYSFPGVRHHTNSQDSASLRALLACSHVHFPFLFFPPPSSLLSSSLYPLSLSTCSSCVSPFLSAQWLLVGHANP